MQRMELARALENAKKASDDKKYSSPLLQAYAYARAEDNDQAMKCLETTYAEHSPRLVWLLMERDAGGVAGRRAVSGIGEAGGVEGE